MSSENEDGSYESGSSGVMSCQTPPKTEGAVLGTETGSFIYNPGTDSILDAGGSQTSPNSAFRGPQGQ